MDVRRKGLFGKQYEIFINNGKKATGLDPVSFAKKAEELGAGEILVNSIDRDGTMQGYDIGLVEKIKGVTTVPLTSLGGAGSIDDIADLVSNFGIIGAAAGSLFVFKGVYKAVLINYPGRSEKEQIFKKSNYKEVKG